MVYAIIENGGKQYKAIEGGYMDLDLMPNEVGQKKVLEKILLLVDGDNVEVGSPLLPKVSVETKVIEHFKSPKINVFKYRPKQRYRVKSGHRQKHTRVLVESIIFPGKNESAAHYEDEKAAEPEHQGRSKPSATGKKSLAKSTAGQKTAPGKQPSKTEKREIKTAPPKRATVSVKKLDLGSRTTAALMDAGINTVAQLAKRFEAGENKLLDLPGIGAKSVEDIKKKLKKLGY